MQIEHKKNTAYYLAFPAVDSTTPANFKTGVSPVDTGYYKDGAGAWTSLAITDTATEIGSTGVYEIDLTAAEMNHDQIIIKFAVANMADTAFLFDMRTKIVSDLNDVSTAQVNTECDTAITDAALATAANLATVDSNVDAILVDTGTTLPATLATIDGNVDAILVDTGTTIPAQISGLNDVAATDIVSAGAITTLAGAVSNVTLVATTTTNTDMRGTDNAATEAKQDIIDTNVDAILVDTGTTLPATLATIDGNVDAILVDTGTTLPATLAGLNDLSAAQVNTEVVDALATDTYAEPGQGAPAATATLAAKINYLYKAWRNKTEQTATTLSLYDDAGTTVDQKSTVSDDGTTATRGEIATGP